MINIDVIISLLICFEILRYFIFWIEMIVVMILRIKIWLVSLEIWVEMVM